MTRYVLHRLALIVVLLAVTSALVFFLSQVLPGNLARSILGGQSTSGEVAALNHKLGLDRPVIDQYLTWLSGFVRGHWGTSLLNQQANLPLVMGRLANSVKLALVALAMLVPVGIGLGVLSAMRQNSILDRMISLVTLSGTVIPEFVSGVILLVVFGVYIHVFPTTAEAPSGAGPLDVIWHLILPALPITFVILGYITRLTRSGTIEVLDSPYIRTAALKGIPRRRVITHHLLRNALPPTVTVVALQAGYILGGLAVIEELFSYPGLGKLLLDSANGHDVTTLEACALTAAAIVMLMNLLADILTAVMDPRVRRATSRA